MTGPASRMTAVLERLSREAPDAVSIARVVSLAARIEPELLRKARLRLLPHVDAGAEADLWFSPLARSHTSLAMSLEPEAAELLRSELAADPALLDAAWAILAEVHANAPPAIVLQEQVTYLALKGATGPIRELLLSAVAAMVVQGRRGVARWALRAVPRLPQGALETDAAQMLIAGAQARLGLEPDVTEGADKWLRWVLPDGGPRVEAGVRMVDGGLEIGAPSLSGSHRVMLPRTNPVFVELGWQERFRHGSSIRAVCFNLDGSELVTGGDDGTVRWWQVAAGREGRGLISQGSVAAVQFSPDGVHLAVAAGRAAWIWNAATGVLELSLEEHEGVVRDVAFAPLSPLLATAGEDGDVRLWDITDMATGTLRNVLRAAGERAAVESIAFDPSGRRVAAGARDGTLRVWTVEGSELLNLPSQAPVRAVAFSPDGRWIAAGGDDGQLRLHDAGSGEAVITVGQGSAIYAVAFSADARYLATGTRAGLRVWLAPDWTSQVQLDRLNDLGAVWAIGISPDGRLAAAGGEEGAIGLVSLENGTEAAPDRNAVITLSEPMVTRFVPMHASDVVVRTALGESFRVRAVSDVPSGGALRVLVTVDPRSWRVTISSTQLEEDWGFSRVMRRAQVASGEAIPLPGAGEAPPLRGADEAPLPDPEMVAASVSEAVRRVRTRHPEPNDVRQIADHLFDSLLGEDGWERILAAARRGRAGSIDLALRWPAPDQDLDRLPWEIMLTRLAVLRRGPEDLTVTITRVPAGSAGRAHPARSPVRLLTVAGSSLSDPALRPGSAYVGLLQNVNRSSAEFHTRVLEEASPERLVSALGRFRPDVVHLVLHGGQDPLSGRWFVEMRSSEPLGQVTRVSPEALLALLQVGDWLPGVVLLSICSTPLGPGLAGATELASFAAGLVAGGVPLVAVIGGPVSDRLSRLLARAIGTAILQDQPIVPAAGRAWRAAATGAHDASHADWGACGVFMSEAIPPGYALTPTIDKTALIDGWIRAANLRYEPVFCGRVEHLEAFLTMLDITVPADRTPQVLLVYAEPGEHGLGRTRLLREMAIRALREGHLPLLIAIEPDRIDTLRTFADEVRRSVIMMYEILELDYPAATNHLGLVLAASEGSIAPAPPEYVLSELTPKRELTSSAVRLAIQADLREMLARAKARYEFFGAGTARVVVLLDDFEHYGSVADDLLFRLLNSSGLGTPDEPVPVVIAAERDAPRRGFVDGALGFPWLRAMPLGPFRSDGEDLLAYETILLHPWNYGGLAGVSDRSWVFKDEDARRTLAEFFRSQIRGIPARMASEAFYAVVGAANSLDLLVALDEPDRPVG